MSQDLIPIVFPKTYNINKILEIADKKTEKIEFVRNSNDGSFKLINEDSISFDIIAGYIELIVKPAEVKHISMLIIDKVIEKSTDENRECFVFKIFNTNGLIITPGLLDINFVCEPKPLNPIQVTIKCNVIKVNEIVKSFFRYNHYYSIHLYTGGMQGEVLAIYYCSQQQPPYNVRFIKFSDIEEFNSVINLPYDWQCPPVYIVKLNEKRKHRIISLTADNDHIKELDNDEVLAFEKHKTIVSPDRSTINFIVHADYTFDVEKYIFNTYGSVVRTTLMNLPVTTLDRATMLSIHNSQQRALELLMK